LWNCGLKASLLNSEREGRGHRLIMRKENKILEFERGKKVRKREHR
jgi:hypothetical protein